MTFSKFKQFKTILNYQVTRFFSYLIIINENDVSQKI